MNKNISIPGPSALFFQSKLHENTCKELETTMIVRTRVFPSVGCPKFPHFLVHFFTVSIMTLTMLLFIVSINNDAKELEKQAAGDIIVGETTICHYGEFFHSRQNPHLESKFDLLGKMEESRPQCRAKFHVRSSAWRHGPVHQSYPEEGPGLDRPKRQSSTDSTDGPDLKN